ncbi:MAG: hydroxyacid dehydrogenase [Pseudomonadota bacterium]
MAGPFVIIPDGFDKELFNQLKTTPGLEVHPASKLSPQELEPLLAKVNALVIRSATRVDAQMLSKAPNMKLVVRAGEGTDNIDKKACAEKGVKVCNTPGANSNSAAEQAIALLFAVLRRTPQAHATTAAGIWEKTKFEGMELWKKKVGVVGLGKIGQIVAKRISGFEPEIYYWDPYVSNSHPYKKVNELKDLFKSCDIITVHLPLIEQTKNLITMEHLSLLHSKAILINAARGGIVNEQDLLTILTQKKIWGAGLDVFSKEPVDPASPFLKLENCVCTPHLGASTLEAQFRVGEMAVNQLKEFFFNNKLFNEVK